MNEKEIIIRRGGSQTPIELVDHDKYDSTLDVKDASGNNLVHLDHVSTVPSLDLFGKNQLALHGIISPGKCGGVWGYTQQLGWHVCLFDLKFWDSISSRDDLNDERVTLESVKINPSMGNQKIVSYVCIHIGGLHSNDSEACQTIYPPEFAGFSVLWKPGEKMFVTIEVADGYVYPVAA